MIITVLGCGVIGLTTAIRLQEEGFHVKIVTKALPEKTTSSVAAAIWMPFKIEPAGLVNRWSRFSYEKFLRLTGEPDSGVSMVDFLILAQNENLPGWAEAMPPGALRKAKPEELPAGYFFGNVAQAPMIETQLYLPFLLKKFREKGGAVIQKEIKNLAAFAASSGLVINCAGLAGGRLAGDSEVFPIRGQIVKVERKPGIGFMADDDGPNALAYILPRRDCIILGGTAEVGNENEQTDSKVTAEILSRCANLDPKLALMKVLSTATGLRPGRSCIRLEWEPGANILHNYGHGGGGYTVSWGCAEEVVHLVNREAD